MNTNYIDNTVKNLTKVYQILMELLNARGFSDESLSRHISNKLLEYKCKQFITNEQSGDISKSMSGYIDIYIYQKIKTYVKFFNINFKIKLSILIDNYKFLINAHDMDDNDEMIFVFLQENFTDAEKEDIIQFETMFHNVRNFHYKNLMLNITKHKLVPQHSLYSGDKTLLYKKLQIFNDEQLPYISHQDPICKFYNFKMDDIIKIDRNCTSYKVLTTYRIVKPVNLCSPTSF